MALVFGNSHFGDIQATLNEYPVKLAKLQKILCAESWLLWSYHVTLKLQQKDEQYQWITVTGKEENVKKAKVSISIINVMK